MLLFDTRYVVGASSPNRNVRAVVCLCVRSEFFSWSVLRKNNVKKIQFNKLYINFSNIYVCRGKKNIIYNRIERSSCVLSVIWGEKLDHIRMLYRVKCEIYNRFVLYIRNWFYFPLARGKY